jgi:hypothetical protein
MRFLVPSLFWFWAPLVLVPIILYLFRPRPRTVKTSTLPFFKWLAKEHQDNAWLRWLKYLLSLLLTVLVVLGGSAALARLVVSPEADEVKTLVIVVDRSASMGARRGDGPTRLELALASLEDRVAGIPAGVGTIVIAYDKRPEVLLARSVDRREVMRTLASINVRPVGGNSIAALTLAEELAGLETPAAIWHATDSVANVSGDEATDEKETVESETVEDEMPDDAATSASDITLETLEFPLSESINVGITAVELRRLPLQRGVMEAFVQVQCSAEQPVEASLDVLIDSEEVDLRQLTLEPGETKTLLVPLKADKAAARIVTLRVRAEGDCLSVDNEVHARIPQLRPIRVLWISPNPDPYMEIALASIGDDDELDIYKGAPDEAWPPKESFDVFMFDDWVPKQWPTDTSVIVINPSGSSGPVQAVRLEDSALPISEIRATDEGHALLFGVATPRIDVAQTAVLAADGPMQPLWIGSHGPVILAGEVQGQRIAVYGFSPQLSSVLSDPSRALPNLRSFPSLIANSVNWAAEDTLQEIQGMNLRTGDLIAPEGKQLDWIDAARPDEIRASVTLEGRAVELDQVGLWQTDAGKTGSAALLSAAETLLPQSTDESDEAESDVPLFRGDLAPALLWTILTILLVESRLYHRCITN